MDGQNKKADGIIPITDMESQARIEMLKRNPEQCVRFPEMGSLQMKTLILPPPVTQEATQSEEAGYKETVIDFRGGKRISHFHKKRCSVYETLNYSFIATLETQNSGSEAHSS